MQQSTNLRNMTQSKRILAVLVLYKRNPEESETFTSLRSILERRPDLAAAMSLLVYDNSPCAQEVPALPIATRYISNSENGGLVAAYNAGLQLADKDGSGWLLLLDHDTVLTEAYLAELISTLRDVEAAVSAVLPKLIHSDRKDRVISPHFIPRLNHRGVDAAFSGAAAEELSAFNSAAALRVSAVKAIGGFPNKHSIEFLDHTVFRLLQMSGGRIWVMGSTLSHKLSVTALGRELSLDRYKNILYAERDFYMRWGSGLDCVWYRLRRLKQCIGHLLSIKNKQFAMWDLRAAIGALGKHS
jgi:GT2 family glycosyltransferase